jgi:uncharacterized protein YjbI with pentapeptide repeats
MSGAKLGLDTKRTMSNSIILRAVRKRPNSTASTRFRALARAIVCASLALTFLGPNSARAQIYRWDNNMLIPGTQGITPGPGVDLSGWNTAGHQLEFADFGFQPGTIDLTSASFANSDLASAFFNSVTLTSANLTGANLTNANLQFVDLTNASFNNASLTGTNLFFADLTGASFNGAGIKGASLNGFGFTAGQLLSTASYASGDLTGVRIYNTDLSGADFANKNLAGASFISATLSGPGSQESSLASANLTGANLTGSTFQLANLTGANFTGATINAAHLFSPTGFTASQLYTTASYASADLSGFGVTGIDLPGVNFATKNLTGASLLSSQFVGAAFTSANLTNASFADSNLANANLTGANLSGANFSRTDLRGATGWTPTGSTTVRNTICPDGSIQGLVLAANEGLVVRNNPIAITVTQSASFDQSSTLQFLLGNTWTSTIAFPGLSPALAGLLQLNFAPGLNLPSQLGHTYRLFDWTGASPAGTFTFSSPYKWDISHLYSTGEVTLLNLLTPGDIDGDGIASVADISALMTALSDLNKYQSTNNFTTAELQLVADLNHDQHVTNADLQGLIIYLANAAAPAPNGGNSTSATGSVTAVPEPSSLILLVIGLVTATAPVLFRSRPRRSHRR